MFLLRSVVSGIRPMGTIDDPQLSCTYMGSNLAQSSFQLLSGYYCCRPDRRHIKRACARGIVEFHVMRLTEIDTGSAIIDTSSELKNLPDPPDQCLNRSHLSCK